MARRRSHKQVLAAKRLGACTRKYAGNKKGAFRAMVAACVKRAGRHSR